MSKQQRTTWKTHRWTDVPGTKAKVCKRCGTVRDRTVVGLAVSSSPRGVVKTKTGIVFKALYMNHFQTRRPPCVLIPLSEVESIQIVSSSPVACELKVDFLKS